MVDAFFRGLKINRIKDRISPIIDNDKSIFSWFISKFVSFGSNRLITNQLEL